MNDLISRQAAIEIIHSLYPNEPFMRINRERWKKRYKQYIEAEKALETLPPEHVTLYGYNIEHLTFIAHMLRQENITPGTVTNLLMDIQRIIKMNINEQTEQIRKVVEHIGEIS